MKKTMTTGKANKMSLHDKAVRLCEGGHVWIQGHYVGAKELPKDVFPCEECKMDSLCHFGDPMFNLCHECDEYTNTPHLLHFACER